MTPFLEIHEPHIRIFGRALYSLKVTLLIYDCKDSPKFYPIHRNWTPLTCATNSIILLMYVHIIKGCSTLSLLSLQRGHQPGPILKFLCITSHIRTLVDKANHKNILFFKGNLFSIFRHLRVS